MKGAKQYLIKKFLFIIISIIIIPALSAEDIHEAAKTGNIEAIKTIINIEVGRINSLDEYKLRKVKKKGTGIWEISVPGDLEFRYFFMVDGVVYLPECEYREADDFGSENCIFVPRS